MAKWTDHGYWVSKLYLVQSWILYFWFAIRSRNPVFFAASNPGILLGGLLDDAKSEAYDLLPNHTVPQTFEVQHSAKAIRIIEKKQLKFPVILKPNIGLKGIDVIKASNIETIIRYFEQHEDKDILAQEFIPYQREFSLMYYRLPLSKEYGINSIVEKIYPSVVGDGNKSIQQFIDEYQDAFLNKEIALAHHAKQLDWIPEKDEKINLHVIGNYSQGAKFKDITNQLNDSLIQKVRAFFDAIDGIDFCRVDFKSNALNDFGGDNFKVLEMNGAKSEPLHIYDKNVSWIKVIRTIYRHWKIMFLQAREQKEMAFKFPSFKEALVSFFRIRQIMNQ